MQSSKKVPANRPSSEQASIALQVLHTGSAGAMVSGSLVVSTAVIDAANDLLLKYLGGDKLDTAVTE